MTIIRVSIIVMPIIFILSIVLIHRWRRIVWIALIIARHILALINLMRWLSAIIHMLLIFPRLFIAWVLCHRLLISHSSRILNRESLLLLILIIIISLSIVLLILIKTRVLLFLVVIVPVALKIVIHPNIISL